MSRIKKYNLENQIHFITGNVYKKIKLFEQYPVCAEMLLKSLDFYRTKLNYKLLAYVVMPEHYHFIIFPSSEATISKIMMVVKGFTAKSIVNFLKQENPGYLLSFKVPESRIKRLKDSVYQIFQKDNYDFNIHSENKLFEKLNYIHYNPVKRGLVTEPEQYIYSSAKDYKNCNGGIINIDNFFELTFPVAEATGLPIKKPTAIPVLGSPLVSTRGKT